MKRRRRFLKLMGAGAAAGIASMAGCSIPLGGNGSKDDDPWETPTETPEPEAAKETFEYFFNDQTGTLGHIGDDVPEDAPDWQVVDNTLEEDDWQQFETNDLTGEGAVNSRAIEDIWQTRVQEGTPEQVMEATRRNFQNPRETFEGTLYNDFYNGNLWEEHDAVIYTASLVKATDDNTNIGSSAYMDWVVPSVAEPFLDRMEIEIPGYRLSSLLTTEAGDPEKNQDGQRIPLEEQNVPRDVAPEDKEGQFIKVGSGLAHPVGFLQYQENGEQRTKIAENTGADRRWMSWIRDPDESLYGLSLDEEAVELNNLERHPAHWVSAFHYDKAREIQEMGGFDSYGALDSSVMGSLYQMVEDIGNDHLLAGDGPGRPESYGRTPGWDIIVDDSFGRSVQDAMNNPTREKSEYMEYAGRAFKAAMDKQGWDEPLRVSGTLEDPTYEHLAREEFEDIIDQRAERFEP